jgi:hypothetical protein
MNVNRRFGETYRLHLQGRRKNFQQEPASKQVTSRILRYDPPKRRLHLNRLNGVIPDDDTFHYPS